MSASLTATPSPTADSPPAGDLHEEAIRRHALHSEVLDLALWAGQMLLQHGADSLLVEETVHRMATAMGADWADVLVHANSMVVSTSMAGEFRTKSRRAPDRGVNMSVLLAVYRLRDALEQSQAQPMRPAEVRAQLTAISRIGHHYPRWLVVVLIGLSCAAFSRLFGADYGVFLLTALAAGAGMATRQQLAKRHVNLYLTVGSTALVATLIASFAHVPEVARLLHIGGKPELALAASVLLLIPGVPLTNALSDLIRGYTVVGLARWCVGSLITLSIALGMLIAMSIMGVSI